MNNNHLKSYRYVFEYEENHPERIENIPFAIEMKTGERPASREEIREYYSGMAQTRNAHTFDTLTAFHEYIENTYYIDRKSTRLNSSHVAISYAVFCLKKKKQI